MNAMRFPSGDHDARSPKCESRVMPCAADGPQDCRRVSPGGRSSQRQAPAGTGESIRMARIALYLGRRCQHGQRQSARVPECQSARVPECRVPKVRGVPTCHACRRARGFRLQAEESARRAQVPRCQRCGVPEKRHGANVQGALVQSGERSGHLRLRGRLRPRQAWGRSSSAPPVATHRGLWH